MAAYRFDYDGFVNYYLAKSKYAKKKDLVSNLNVVWRKVGCNYLSGYGLNSAVADVFNRSHDRLLMELMGYGHSSAASKAILKCLSDWLKR